MTNDRLLEELLADGQRDIAADLLLDEGMDLEAEWVRCEGVMPPEKFRWKGETTPTIEFLGTSGVEIHSVRLSVAGDRVRGGADGAGYGSGGNGYTDGQSSGSGNGFGGSMSIGWLINGRGNGRGDGVGEG